MDDDGQLANRSADLSRGNCNSRRRVSSGTADSVLDLSSHHQVRRAAIDPRPLPTKTLWK